MAVDGSFGLEFGLERFFSRRPELASVPQFDYLVKKRNKLTEEEVVNAVAELFLLPNYTISVVGCFRPISQKIVDRAVTLLRLVPNLTSNSDVPGEEFDEDKFLREPRVIDFYARSGNGLKLHELACLAFCRALDLVPSLLGSVLSYFKFSPPPFERIKQKAFLHATTIMAGDHVLNVVRVSYRFLLAELEVFTTL